MRQEHNYHLTRSLTFQINMDYSGLSVDDKDTVTVSLDNDRNSNSFEMNKLDFTAFDRPHYQDRTWSKIDWWMWSFLGSFLNLISFHLSVSSFNCKRSGCVNKVILLTVAKN
jgi:hypothetical protein